MRTHRLKFVCSSAECAKHIEEESLAVDYCDLTHWFCGLDGAGEDTPDSCIIYRGIVEPNVVYVELALSEVQQDDNISKELAKFDCWKNEDFFKKLGKDWKVTEISAEELPSYIELKKAKKELKLIKTALSSLMTRKD